MGSSSTTPYLAPTLQQDGFIGATGTTPYKPVSPEGVQALQNLYTQPPLQNVKPVISSTAQVININLDGTQNNGWFPEPGESPTNVFQLAQIQENIFGRANTIYLPGVGAPQGTEGSAQPDVPASNIDSVNWNAGPIANQIVERAYLQLKDRVTEIRQQDPNAAISINVSGFSRGGAQAVALANLIEERGIPGLFDPGQSRIDSLLLYDPVDMTNGELNTAWPTNVENNLVLVAMGESRHIMPAMPLGSDANVVGVAEASHANTGGSFNPQGIQAVTLGAGLKFQQAAGMTVSDAPQSLQPDWTQMHAHDSSLDNFGNEIWSTHDGGRYYEGADRTDPSVHDVIVDGAVPPFGKPAMVQPPDPSLPQGLLLVESQPDGSMLYHYANGAHVSSNASTGEYHMQVPMEDGGGYLVYSRVRNEDGSYTVEQFELNAQGELLGRQTGVQSSLQAEVTWDEPDASTPDQASFDTQLPNIGTPPTPGPGVVVAGSGNGVMTDGGLINGYGDGDVQGGPAPATQELVGQSLGQWAATVTPEQVAALLQLLSENGLDAQALGNVRILDNADGTQMLALDSASGYLTPIGQLQPSANDNGWTTLHLLGSDPDSPLHLGPQGQVFGHEQYVQASVQTATQGLNLFTGLLSGIENWGQLNTLQQLNTLTSIYSQIDNLGSAFAQGNHLPGNLGSAGGALAFLNALDGGSDYAVVSSGLSLAQQGLELWSNVLSNQAFDLVSQMGSSALVDVAMSQAYDSALQSAAQSGAIAQGIGEAIPYLNLIYSLSNIEENPMGAAISALSMMGPYGQLAAAVLTVFSMVMDNDIPPSIGEAEVQIDASGAVVVNTTQDEQGGGGTAAAWAQQLAQVAVGAGMSAPQAGAPAQHLPSVGYYYDPDGFNFENSNGQLALRWIDEDGTPQQLLYDSNGMRWDGNSVEGQSDIMRDYLLLMQSRQPQWPPVMYQEVTGGVLRLDYGVATVLYATALGTYDGMAGHMHGGDEDTDGGQAYIGVGSAQIHSLSDHTVESSTGQPTRVTLGAGQIQSVPPAMGPHPQGPQPPKGRDPIVFVPARHATPVTPQMSTKGQTACQI